MKPDTRSRAGRFVALWHGKENFTTQDKTMPATARPAKRRRPLTNYEDFKALVRECGFDTDHGLPSKNWSVYLREDDHGKSYQVARVERGSGPSQLVVHYGVVAGLELPVLVNLTALVAELVMAGSRRLKK